MQTKRKLPVIFTVWKKVVGITSPDKSSLISFGNSNNTGKKGRFSNPKILQLLVISFLVPANPNDTHSIVAVALSHGTSYYSRLMGIIGLEHV